MKKEEKEDTEKEEYSLGWKMEKQQKHQEKRKIMNIETQSKAKEK